MKLRLALSSRVLLVVCLAIALISTFWFAISARHIEHLTLATGDLDGESYILGQAIAEVVHLNHPRLEIAVISTSGSDENLEKLEQGTISLSIVQADIAAGPSARTVAVLYEDTFQLIVRPDSGITQFHDLVGHKIVLQPNSGEFYSFLELTDHYGLKLTDFELSFANGAAANEQFRGNEVDALFRVRTLNNNVIARIVQETRAHILSIEQAKSLRVRHPALEPSQIPKGVYQGYPPIPSSDLPAISVRRLLVANRNLDPKIVRQLTQVLLENQREIANAIPDEYAELRPIVAGIKRPNPSEGTGLALHRGAISYYERDRPTLLSSTLAFLAGNGAFLIALTTLPAGSLVGLWEWWQRLRQEAGDRKLLADHYIDGAIRSMEIPTELDFGNRHAQIHLQQKQLEQLLVDAANSLTQGQITQEAFGTFNEAYNTARLVLQRCIENVSKDLCDQYIERLIHLENPSAQDFYGLLQEVETSLVKKEITYAAFRTFMDAYQAVFREKRVVAESPTPLRDEDE